MEKNLYYPLYTQFTHSIVDNDLSSVKEYLDKYPDIADNGCLNLAYQHSNLEMIKALTESNSQNITTLDLGSAAREHSQEIVEYLLNCSLRQKMNDLKIMHQINEALTSASENNDVNLASYLISQGANIYYNRSYAMGLACSLNHVDMVRYFLKVVDKEDTEWQNHFSEAFIFSSDENNTVIRDLFLQEGMSIEWLKYGDSDSKEYMKYYKTKQFKEQLDEELVDNKQTSSKMKI